MKKRLAIAFAAIVMLICFLTVIVGALVALPLFILGYVITGSDWLYARIGAFGHGLDSCANVPWLDGHPKETISSHTGRFYEAKYGNPYKKRPATNPDQVIPWQAAFVKWLTDKAETNHVYKAVEQWAVDAKIDL